MEKKHELLDVIKSTLIVSDDEPVSEETIRMMEEIRSVNRGDDGIKKLHILPDAHGLVNRTLFDKCLDVYENNQEYYIDKLTKLSNLIKLSNDMREINRIEEKIDQVKKNVTLMEYWFLFIIEPKPSDRREHENWHDGEMMKLENSRTKYCDRELASLIKPLPSKIVKKLETIITSHVDQPKKKRK